MKIKRTGLKIETIEALDCGEGSYNVDLNVEVASNDIYDSYQTTLLVGWFVRGIEKGVKVAGANGKYKIPAQAMETDGPLRIALLLEKDNQGLVTNELRYPVLNAPHIDVVEEEEEPEVVVSAYESALIDGTITSHVNDDITVVRSYAYYKQPNLSVVRLANALQIGEYAFSDCTKLLRATFEIATKVLGNAFANCVKGEELNLLACTTLDQYALKSSGFDVYNLPSLKTIGKYAFQTTDHGVVNMDSLLSAGTYGFHSAVLDEVNMPVCMALEDRCFESATIGKINAPLVKSIGARTFSSAKVNSTLLLPSCTSVNTYGCMGFTCTKMIFESPVTFAGDSFSNGKITSVVLTSNTMSTLSKTSAFSSCSCKFYVPAALLDSYLADTNWSTISSSRFLTIEDNPDILLD